MRFYKDSKIINDTLYYVPISKSGFNFEKISINDIFVLMTMKSLILENLYLEPIDTGEISLAELF